MPRTGTHTSCAEVDCAAGGICTCTGAAGGAGDDGACCTDGGGTDDSGCAGAVSMRAPLVPPEEMKLRISVFVTRPSLPLPCTSDRSILFSRAILRTAGVAIVCHEPVSKTNQRDNSTVATKCTYTCRAGTRRLILGGIWWRHARLLFLCRRFVSIHHRSDIHEWRAYLGHRPDIII